MTMSEDSPKIVSLETSLELSAFPSEAEFASEAGPQAEAAPQFPAVALSQAPPPPEAPPRTVEPNLEPFSIAAVPRERSEPPILIAPPVAGDDVDEGEDEPAHAGHAGPATVTEFPVRPHTPAAVALPSLPVGPVTLVELIERRGGFDWREAVAVIHQICLYLKEHSPQTPILLDPRSIQITDKGEVHLLSGQTSSDPLVIQVGRLLRTMLMGKEAPPELRLLLSQATFELPIFESIDDVDRALAQLNKLDEPGPAGLALLRAVASPPPPPNPDDDPGHRPPPIRSILPAQRAAARRQRSRGSQFNSIFGSYSSHVALIFAAILVIGALLLTRPTLLFPSDAPVSATAQAAPIAVGTVSPATPEPSASSPAGSAPREAAAAAPRERNTAAPRVREAGSSRAAEEPPPVRRPPASGREGVGIVVVTPGNRQPTTGETPRPGSGTPSATATVGIGRAPSAPTAPPSPRESERRAASLLAQGRAAAASMAFDALVMSNPLYEPRTSDLSPEALAAFRTSQKLMLPMVAQRGYDLAKSALAAGDPDRALAHAKEAAAIIDRRLAETPPQLRDQVVALMAQATEAAAALNEIVYTEADLDVIPPRQLTTQMPVTGPIGVPANRVGWLDMIIGRDGTVERVKLNTPLNRHHERMIVSAAKAWKFRPASKGARSVRYRITVKINLPESGTN
jgi:hypothetical protein